MYAQMFKNSPLLAFPLVGLVLFVAMFVAVVIYLFRSNPRALEQVATMPLTDDESPVLDAPKEVSHVR